MLTDVNFPEVLSPGRLWHGRKDRNRRGPAVPELLSFAGVVVH